MILKAIIHKITMLKAVHKYIRIYLYTSIKPENFKVCVQKIRVNLDNLRLSFAAQSASKKVEYF